MGPLAGFRIIEMAGIGPAPFAATLLADMGAEVIRVDRREAADLGLPGREPKFDVLHRGRRSLALDVKAEAGRAVVKQLAAKADALIEGFRPGVMERLGLGPEELLKINPKLVFGRMTGFGQDGPLAQAAGHDINYIALAGALHAIGRKGEGPVPPLNLVGDFGGGGMFLAFGVLCGLLEAQKSGKGQVVDAAMVDGAAYLLAGIYGLYSQGSWADERGVNFVDSGAPWYDVYKTRDGKWLSVGAIEKRFYEELVEKLGLASAGLPKQHDRKGWPILRERFAAAIASKTRDEWERVFEGSDACVAPVLALGEVESHPHNVARATFVRRDGVLQPGPAPRFSRTACEMGPPARGRGADSEAVLRDWGFAPAEIAELTKVGVVGADKSGR
ncbi:MAG: CoA transferase [Alphaproteobacteria bacterium]|nr:MAG: CoA transferase [Alphaproteobacteria bacterium]